MTVPNDTDSGPGDIRSDPSGNVRKHRSGNSRSDPSGNARKHRSGNRRNTSSGNILSGLFKKFKYIVFYIARYIVWPALPALLICVLCVFGYTVYFHPEWGIIHAVSNPAAPNENGFSLYDLDGTWNLSHAPVPIAFRDGQAVMDGTGAHFDDGTLTIMRSGYYALSGELDGVILVNAEQSDMVWLLLDGLTLRHEDGPAILIEKAAKVFLTLPENKQNLIVCGDAFSKTYTTDGLNGAVFSKVPLTLNGPGALDIRTGYGHGITCNDHLLFTGGNIDIEAVKDGLHSHKSVRCTGNGVLDLTIRTGENHGQQGIGVDSRGGYVYINGGTVSIEQSYEGIEAERVQIQSGTVTIRARDDGINAHPPKAGTPSNGQQSSPAAIQIGGDSTVTIINSGGSDVDGLDSENSVYITGGDTRISVGTGTMDFAVDYEPRRGVFEISGGRLIACGGGGGGRGAVLRRNNPMSEDVSQTSTQPSITCSMAPNAAPGTSVALLRPGEDIPLVSWESVDHAFSSVIISAPEMEVGQTYILDIGGERRLIPVTDMVTFAYFSSAISIHTITENFSSF